MNQENILLALNDAICKVYVNGKYIGSDEQIKALDAAGELRKTLTEAGAAM